MNNADLPSKQLSPYLDKWGLLDKGFSYDVVAVFGSQSTGKSELLELHELDYSPQRVVSSASKARHYHVLMIRYSPQPIVWYFISGHGRVQTSTDHKRFVSVKPTPTDFRNLDVSFCLL